MDFAKNWDFRDSALLTTALGATYADTKATKDLLARGGQETNPLLGRNPSGTDLDKAALLAGTIGTGIASVLPERWRRPALGAWAGLEAGLAYKNAHVNPKEKTTGLAGSHLEGPLMMAALGGLAGYALNDNPSRTVSITPTENRGLMLTATQKFSRGGQVKRGFGRIGISTVTTSYHKPTGFRRIRRAE